MQGVHKSFFTNYYSISHKQSINCVVNGLNNNYDFIFTWMQFYMCEASVASIIIKKHDFQLLEELMYAFQLYQSLHSTYKAQIQVSSRPSFKGLPCCNAVISILLINVNVLGKKHSEQQKCTLCEN